MEIVKPKNILFLALDGVAPRSKMNQQRQRRYRVAAERLKNKEEAGTFDTNAITPGTEFMQKVTQELKFFIQYKISTDENWQHLKVILSGAEVGATLNFNSLFI